MFRENFSTLFKIVSQRGLCPARSCPARSYCITLGSLIRPSTLEAILKINKCRPILIRKWRVSFQNQYFEKVQYKSGDTRLAFLRHRLWCMGSSLTSSRYLAKWKTLMLMRLKQLAKKWQTAKRGKNTKQRGRQKNYYKFNPKKTVLLLCSLKNYL